MDVLHIGYLIHVQHNFATITASPCLYVALLVIGHNDMGANSAVLAVSFFASQPPPRFSRAKRERAGSAWRTTFLRS